MNKSRSATAATPAISRPEAALRFATLCIVNRSGIVKVLVSVSGNTSMGVLGSIYADVALTTVIVQ